MIKAAAEFSSTKPAPRYSENQIKTMITKAIKKGLAEKQFEMPKV